MPRPPVAPQRALMLAMGLATCLATASVQAQAVAPQPAGPARGVVQLSASATQEIAQDTLAVTLGVTRDGSQATEVQTQLKQVLDAALAEARRSARPGQIDVRTGAFSMSPRYDTKGRINGWQGTAQLLLEGQDMAGIGQLAGKLSASMNVQQVAYGLSRGAREAAESALMGQAIGRWQAKAQDVAKALGASGYAVGEISIQSGEPGFDQGVQPMLMRSVKAEAMADAPPPVAPGKGLVSVSVSGSMVLNPPASAPR